MAVSFVLSYTALPRDGRAAVDIMKHRRGLYTYFKWLTVLSETYRACKGLSKLRSISDTERIRYGTVAGQMLLQLLFGVLLKAEM